MSHGVDFETFKNFVQNRDKIHIPFYQRPYESTDEKNKMLVEKIETAKKTRKEVVFSLDIFFSIVGNDWSLNSECVEIIDGQQRLVSMFIALMALSHLAHKREWSKKVKTVKEDYRLTHQDSKRVVEKFIFSNPQDQESMSSVVSWGLIGKDLERKSSSSISKAARFFWSYFSSSISSEKDWSEVYTALGSIGFHKKKVERDESVQVFREINSGTSLEPHNQVRALLCLKLQEIGFAEEDIKHSFSVIESNLFSCGAKKPYKRFVLAYARSYGDVHSGGELEVFSSLLSRSEPVASNILTELETYSKHFSDIHKGMTASKRATHT
jgi:hypothetical protein